MTGGEYGKIFKRVWGDADFKALTCQQQLLYLKLVSQTDISLAGVLTLATIRWAGQTAGVTDKDIARTLAELEAARFIVCDRETQEVLVRSYVRNDLGWRSSKTMKAVKAAVGRILSPRLRGVISAELLNISASNIGCHDHNGILEVNCSPLSISEASVVQKLQHYIKNVVMSFFYLVEENH